MPPANPTDSSIEDGEVELPGFYCYRRDRNRNGGGVCLFIRTKLSFIPCPELQIETLEAAWVEIRLPKTKAIVVGVCYRPPKQNDFYELLESVCIDSNVLMERECIVLGDFNMNLLMTTKNGLLKKLLHFCKVLGLEQLIMEPTSVDMHTKFILDLVLVTDSKKISSSGVLDIGISDHNVIFCTHKISKVKIGSGSHHSIKLRCTIQDSKEAFECKLAEQDWSTVTDSNDADRTWELFKGKFLTVHHVGMNEFKRVEFLPVKLRVEQLKLKHMYNIINGVAPKYLGF